MVRYVFEISPEIYQGRITETWVRQVFLLICLLHSHIKVLEKQPVPPMQRAVQLLGDKIKGLHVVFISWLRYLIREAERWIGVDCVFYVALKLWKDGFEHRGGREGVPRTKEVFERAQETLFDWAGFGGAVAGFSFRGADVGDRE